MKPPEPEHDLNTAIQAEANVWKRPAPARAPGRRRIHAVWAGGLLLACLLCAFGPAGYRHVKAWMRPAIIGKWESVEPVMLGARAMEFREDGTGESILEPIGAPEDPIDFKWRLEGDSLIIDTLDSQYAKKHRKTGLVEIYAWKLDDGKLTITLVSPRVGAHHPLVLRRTAR